MVLKDLFANGDGLFLSQTGKTKSFKRGFATLYNKGGGVVAKLVSMGPDPAMFGFFKNKGKTFRKLPELRGF